MAKKTKTVEDSFQEQIFSEIKRRVGNKNMIVIAYPILIFCGDLETAIILSQLIYWCDRGKRSDGYIFKSYKEWKQETSLSEYKVRQAINKLKGKGILLIKTERANGSPTLHYKLDQIAFRDVFLKFLQKEKERFGNGNLETEESITELNTENNAESIEEKNIDIPILQKEKKTVEANPEGFNRFWEVYPRKVDKKKAIRAWKKLNPSHELLEEILDFIDEAQKSEDWKQKNGLFIPKPNTFLSDRRWEDELIYKQSWKD